MSVYVVLCRCARGGVPSQGERNETVAVEVPDRSGDSFERARSIAVGQFASRHGIDRSLVHHWGSF